ncbi:hypothetical protein NC652_022560 [Populus alba x Populus x berolinensis]|nr:hypothetical protein NC652_022560 [Populus alba x Populus x berolinensis]
MGDACKFALHAVDGRWFSVFASFLIMAGAGATYLFGTYSKDIKATLGYDQTTLNLLGFFKDLGANVGVLSGLLAEVTPTWFVLVVGSAMNFVGYFMIWMSVTQRIAKPAGFVGLSGAIFTQFYLAIYGTDSKSLILLIGWLPAALSVIFAYTVRERKPERQPNELKVFYQFLIVSIILALFLMAVNIVEKVVDFSKAAYAGSATVVCVMLFIPLIIAIKEDWIQWNLKHQEAMKPATEATAEKKLDITPEVKSEISKEQEEKVQKSCFLTICNKPPRGEDYTILQALLSIDMLILFAATFCGLGASLTAVDNLGQIGESLGYPTKTIKSFVSLVSIWNFFGRVFAGFVSESLLVRYKMPRPLMMTFVLLLACVGYLLIAFPFSGSVYVASVITGFSFGAQLPLLFAIISELFGLKYYSTLFNCGQLASPLGSYILNVKVTGLLYDNEAVKELAKKGLG